MEGEEEKALEVERTLEDAALRRKAARTTKRKRKRKRRTKRRKRGRGGREDEENEREEEERTRRTTLLSLRRRTFEPPFFSRLVLLELRGKATENGVGGEPGGQLLCVQRWRTCARASTCPGAG